MSVYVSSHDLELVSSQLSALANEIKTVFQEMNALMTATEGVWYSPASQRLLAQYSQLKPTFDAHHQMLLQYALFLKQTAMAYQENESSLEAGLS